MIQKVDLQSLTYVDDDPCSKEFECSICHSPLVDPLLTPHCEHWFCKECLLGLFDVEDKRRRATPDNAGNEAKYRCPNCRKELNRTSPWAKVPRGVTNMLAELQVS